MAWYSRRNRVIALCVAGGAFIAYWAYMIHVPVWQMDREVLSQRDAARRKAEAHLVRKTVDVIDAYALRWAAREGARALDLSIPAVDLGAWMGAHPRIEETSAGPLVVRMQYPVPDAGLVVMDLHREPAEHRREGILQPVLVRGGERPRLLGIDCREVQPSLGERKPDGTPATCHAVDWRERIFARTYDLKTIEVRLQGGGHECVMDFPFAGRLAILRVEQPCRSGRALAALVAAYDRLAVREADAAKAPSNPARLERAAAAAGACASAASDERKRQVTGRERFDPRASDLCAYAAHLAYPLLKPAPVEAATLMSQAMIPNIGRSERWDADYLDEIIAALDKARAGDSPAAVWAHTARVQAPRTPRPGSQPRYQSLASLMGASSPPPTEDPRQASDDPEARRLASLAALAAIAERAPANSELALKARFAVCRQRIEQRVEGVDLKQCGEVLLAAWESRIATGGAFTEFTYGEPELATTVPRLFIRYGHESGDFEGALPGTRRAVALARERLPRDYGMFLQGMADAEQVIAGKARR